ncbi:hypothetical protein, partial [Acidiphilium sp.]|uniref:hypothetical protein n=1 Tax=Acidiphilium sp. TaxID=527 RepID=UPI002CD6434E
MDDRVIGGLISEFDLEPLARRQDKARMSSLVGQTEDFRRATVHFKAARSRDQPIPCSGDCASVGVNRAHRTQRQATGNKAAAGNHRHLLILFLIQQLTLRKGQPIPRSGQSMNFVTF